MSTLLVSSCFLHFKYYLPTSLCLWEFFKDTGGSVVKNLPAIAGDVGSIPGSGRSLGVGNNNLLQYSYLEKFHRQRSLEGCSLTFDSIISRKGTNE